MTISILLAGFDTAIASDIEHILALSPSAPTITQTFLEDAKNHSADLTMIYVNSEGFDASHLPQGHTLMTVSNNVIGPSAHIPHLSLPVSLDGLFTALNRLRDTTDEKTIPVTQGWLLCPKAKTLTHPESDASIKLTEKETELLVYFLNHRNHTIDRDVLLKELWGYDEAVDTHTLETHIYRLRSKLAESIHTPDLIVTTDAGYGFMV